MLAVALLWPGIQLAELNPGFVETPLTAGTAFHMPALITPEQAARAMLQGWARGRFEIHFPRRFTLWLKLLRHLPHGAYFGVAALVAVCLLAAFDRRVALIFIAAAAIAFGLLHLVALGLMNGLARAGRQVGRDIRLVGFDDIEAASLVSPAAYRPDRVRPASQLAVGSGPYRMEIITEHRVGFTAYPDYVGFAPSGQERLSIQRYEASEFLRNAMTNAEVDVVWGGLDEQQEGALGVQVEA